MAKKITIKGKDIIKELGLEKAPIAKQEEMVNRMSEIVYNRILLKMVKKMTKKDVGQMTELLEKKDKDEINNFLEKKFPNFAQIFKEELLGFQKEIIKKAGA